MYSYESKTAFISYLIYSHLNKTIKEWIYIEIGIVYTIEIMKIVDLYYALSL